MQNDGDKDLAQLFQEELPELPEEPFVGELLRRVEKARSRYHRIRWLLTALVLAVCAVATPYVVGMVVLFCDWLTRVMEISVEFFITPVGCGVMIACVLLAQLFRHVGMGIE